MNTSEISQLMDKHDIKTFSNMDELNAAIGYELSRLTGFKFEMGNCFQMKQYVFAFPAEHLVQFVKIIHLTKIMKWKMILICQHCLMWKKSKNSLKQKKNWKSYLKMVNIISTSTCWIWMNWKVCC